MVKLVTDNYTNDVIVKSLRSIFDSSVLCSVATVNIDQTSYINTAYFSYDESFNLYFLSDPQTNHCKNIECNPSVAITVFDSNQPWGEAPLLGLQLFGTARLLPITEQQDGAANYGSRFSAYNNYISSLTPRELDAFPSRFYQVHPQSFKILDEVSFGEENYVTVNIITS